MQLAHKTLVAVADGARFSLFRNSGSEAQPNLVAIGSPDVGHRATDAGSRHHGGAANPSDRQIDEDSYASAIASLLNKMGLDGEIDALIVVAPAKTMGELRKHWHKGLSTKIVAEVVKEMTGASAREITEALAKHA